MAKTRRRRTKTVDAATLGGGRCHSQNREQVLRTLSPIADVGPGHLAGSGRRPQTSRRGDRIPQHPAYLGTDLAAASPPALRRTGRRTVVRPSTLDRFTRSLLLTGEGAQPGFSWEVRGWIATCWPYWPIGLPRRMSSPGRPASR